MPQASLRVAPSPPTPHLVQLYDADESSLTRTVGRYLYEGWQQGDGLVVIAAEEHAMAFTAELGRLGVDVAAAVRGSRLLVLDAHATLARFLVDGRPDRERFRRTATDALARVGRDGAQIRAYGEMVGLLWQAGQADAAIELETLWNEVRDEQPFELFCAYPIDVFGDAFDVAGIDKVLRTHTHLVPTGGDRDLEGAIERAMTDVLGVRADGLRPLMTANHQPAWGAVPRGEAVILWLRNNLPDYAGEILSRARRYYGSCA